MWQRLESWFFPVSCLGCEQPHVALCSACGPGPGERITESVANVGVAAAGAYAGILRKAIVRMKQGERAYLDPFSVLIAGLGAANAQFVPLPTSRGRRASRGFDQAVELARRAAGLRGGSCWEVLVKRGSAQRGLDRRARLAAGGRFRIKRGAQLPELAVVVDDVWTTGATLGDGIATLRAAGVAVVGAVVLARTAPGRNSRAQRTVLSDGSPMVVEHVVPRKEPQS